jgi:hypothetical protein
MVTPLPPGNWAIHLLLMAKGYMRRREFLVDEEFDPEAAKL